MNSSSILEAIKKLKLLLTRQEKIKWLSIVSFALVTSFFEMLTASIIVIFAQILNQPEMGPKYLSKMGYSSNLSSARILFYAAIIVGIVYVIKNIIAALEVFYQNFSIQNMSYNFKNKLLQRYAMADYGFYLTRNSSIGGTVVGGEVNLMFSSGMIPLATIISESMVFIGLLTMIIVMKPSLAIVVLVFGMACSIAVSKLLFPLFYRWGQRLQEASMLSSQNLSQFFHAFKEIVLLGKRENFINNYQFHAFKTSKVHAVQTATNQLPRIIIEVVFVGLFVFAIAYLCYKHDTPQKIIGILGGYLYAGFRLMPGLNRIIGQLNTFKASIASIDRVYNEYTTVAAKENYLDIPDFKFTNNIIFKNVYFKYLNTERDAIQNINLEIKKGESIGIIGETGSGKSTLVDLLLGLLRPCTGEILIDGLYPANCYQWHQKIGYVPQAVYLIDDTIEANIAFGEKISNINLDRLNQVINISQLRKFIEQLPLGAKTIVGERGIRLSGGERQRIAIARALYRDPEVLIFDEATSALDIETEARLMETVNAVSKERTVIMIAHRVSTLKDCNRIVIMDKGVINIKN
jgi:ATP-binding cassette, subfamily B, bacterial PglK